MTRFLFLTGSRARLPCDCNGVHVDRPSGARHLETFADKRKKAVLLVANYPSDVGYAWWLMEAFWASIAAEVCSAGRRCVLAFPRINAVPELIKEAPIELLQWQVRPRSIGDAFRGAKRLRQMGVTSIYLTDWPAYSYLYMIWRMAGVRHIVLHDHTPGDRPVLRGPRAWLKSLIHLCGIFSCNSYVGVSEYIQRRFSENGRVPASRCFVVRNGIRSFSCGMSSRAEVRSRICVPESAMVVVLSSRATFYKGWDFAVRCLGRLVAREPAGTPVHFVFCGDGPDLDSFKALAASLGVAERCHFLGRRDDVREIICAADVAFHPSRGEALSLATLEFMCASLPVVLPDRPSVCGVVRDQVDGVTYSAEVLDAAVDALAPLLDEPERRRRLGSAARATVLSGYQLEQTLAEFRRVVVPRL